MKSHLRNTILGLAALALAVAAGGARAQLSDATTVGQTTSTPSYCTSIDGTSYEYTQWFASAADVAAKTGLVVQSQNAGAVCCTAAKPWNGSVCMATPPSCPAAPVTAGACSYSLPTTASGSSATVGTSTAGYSGSVTASCTSGSWSLGAATCTPPAPAISLTVNGSTTAKYLYVGDPFTLAWSATNSPSSISISCGAIGSWAAAANPSSSTITATAAMAGAGTQNCVATATNAGGTGSSAAVPLTVYPVTAQLNTKVVYLNGKAGFGSTARFATLTGSANSIKVDFATGGGAVTGTCTLTTPGQSCQSASWTDGTTTAGAGYWHTQFRTGVGGPYGVALGSGFGRLVEVKLNTDGSISFWTYGSGTGAAFYVSNTSAYQDSNVGTLTAAQVRALTNGQTVQFTDWMRL